MRLKMLPPDIIHGVGVHDGSVYLTSSSSLRRRLHPPPCSTSTSYFLTTRILCVPIMSHVRCASSRQRSHLIGVKRFTNVDLCTVGHNCFLGHAQTATEAIHVPMNLEYDET